MTLEWDMTLVHKFLVLYSWTLKPTQSANGPKMWLFIVTAAQIAGLDSKQVNGHIRMEMQFSPQLAGNVTLLVMSEEPATV